MGCMAYHCMTLHGLEWHGMAWRPVRCHPALGKCRVTVLLQKNYAYSNENWPYMYIYMYVYIKTFGISFRDAFSIQFMQNECYVLEHAASGNLNIPETPLRTTVFYPDRFDLFRWVWFDSVWCVSWLVGYEFVCLLTCLFACLFVC